MSLFISSIRRPTSLFQAVNFFMSTAYNSLHPVYLVHNLKLFAYISLEVKHLCHNVHEIGRHFSKVSLITSLELERGCILLCFLARDDPCICMFTLSCSCDPPYILDANVHPLSAQRRKSETVASVVN